MQYQLNFNEIEFVGKFSKLNKIDVLYFADSMKPRRSKLSILLKY